MVPGKDIGPVISREAKERIERYIAEAEAAAPRCWSTAAARVPGRENGYYVGPTIIDHVTPDMRIAQEEVFGPVLVIVRATTSTRRSRSRTRRPTAMPRRCSPRAAASARYVMEHASAGMVGVNVGVRCRASRSGSEQYVEIAG